jgi:hypothetical protein
MERAGLLFEFGVVACMPFSRVLLEVAVAGAPCAAAGGGGGFLGPAMRQLMVACCKELGVSLFNAAIAPVAAASFSELTQLGSGDTVVGASASAALPVTSGTAAVCAAVFLDVLRCGAGGSRDGSEGSSMGS